MPSTTIMSINNIAKDKSALIDSTHHTQESFVLTWNDILHDGGLATWTARSSFRWLTISVCLIGIIGKLKCHFLFRYLSIHFI